MSLRYLLANLKKRPSQEERAKSQTKAVPITDEAKVKADRPRAVAST
jgi:hypothetical protein